MCVLCVEIQRQSMTFREVARAYREFEIPEGHDQELLTKLEERYGVTNVVEELNALYLEELTKGIP